MISFIYERIAQSVVCPSGCGNFNDGGMLKGLIWEGAFFNSDAHDFFGANEVEEVSDGSFGKRWDET